MKRFFQIGGGVWAHRDVRLILPARTLTLAGHATALVTLLLQAHDRGVGTMGVAALLIALAVPAIATMGIAGRLADTFDSRRLLTAGIAVQILALLFLAWSPTALLTLVGVVVLELGQAVIGPVWSGLLPRVVGQDGIGSVISWQQGLGAVAAPIGAALGGVGYGRFGAGPALLASAIAFAALLGAVQLIRTRRHVAAESALAGSPTAERGSSGILAGVAVLRADRVVWPVFLALLPMVVMVEGVNAVEVFLRKGHARGEPGAVRAR